MTEKIAQLKSRRQETGHDFIGLGIVASAILMFVGIGGAVVPEIFRNWAGLGPGPDTMLVNALLLNIALIIFGWRRYSELLAELEQHRIEVQNARVLAETDVLTNCLNRRSITPETDALIHRAHKAGQQIAFIMLDLDNFKQVNDCNGHQIGDEVLQTTAQRIRAVLPDGSLLARLGGDEFACVVSFDPSHQGSVDQLVNRLIAAVSEPVRTGGQEIEITISAGIAATGSSASTAPGALNAKSLLHCADIAMYQAKKQGRNRYFWFESEMEQQLRLRNQLEAGIRKGLTNGEFKPYYEQQIDLHSGELVGFEMLARWISPQLGIVNPDVFIPIAEELGLIGDLSAKLIEQALSDASQWDPTITVSVNISPIELRDPWFAQKILKLLVKHNFPAQRLEIEITESCLHENLGLVRSMITSLRNQGIQISLDDFGTGYSSLSQLQSLPFDRLKIGRNFVSDLAQDRGDSGSKIIDAIISLGDDLSIPITAEGIEDEETLERLKKMGPLRGQGYHYGLPETAEEVRTRLAELGLYRAVPPEGAVMQAHIAETQPATTRRNG